MTAHRGRGRADHLEPQGCDLQCPPCGRAPTACSDAGSPAEGIVTAVLRHALTPEHIADTGGKPVTPKHTERATDER
ncbi:hypothetical protein ABZ599_18080 [Streptomyces misionensis]|uniref:hypothetical protein n=1 Tax=Streptomyces misionensis TaxID=67331 RepID=UPI0033C517DC